MSLGAGVAQAAGAAILTAVVLAFVCGAALVGFAVWLWPYLPTVSIVW